MEMRKENKIGKRIAVLGFASLLLLSSVFAIQFTSLITESLKTWYVGPTVPPSYPDFASIQEAINNASVMPGDIIEVLKNGTSPYYEYVVVNKSLTIRNYAGHQPIIDGKNTGTIVNITASNVVFSGFKIQNGWNGLCIYGSSSGNTIDSNTVLGIGYYGILVGGLGNNSLNGNSVATTYGGGIFIVSPNNTLQNNLITGFNGYNFGVYSYYNQTIGTSNKVNGKPIYYLVDQYDKQVQLGAGYIAIVNSRNITVRNQGLSCNFQGLLVVNSTNIYVEDSNFTKNYRGILLEDSTNSTIKNVKASYNIGGIDLSRFNNNTIIGNEVSYNDVCGIHLDESNNNTIIRNTIKDNSCGIELISSNGIAVYHNNFIGNTNQAIVTDSIDNKWNNGAEGNYWSNYIGLDNGSGGRVAGDGIGDTDLPAPPGPSSVDYYPLMEPWEPVKVFNVRWTMGAQSGVAYEIRTLSNSTRASFKFNMTTRQINFIITSGTSESCNITIPRDLLDYNFTLLINDIKKDYILTLNETHTSLYFTYNPGIYHIKIIGMRVVCDFGDLNRDGKVNIYDLRILARNYGKQIK